MQQKGRVRGAERVNPSKQPPLSFTLPADLIQSCSVLAGLLGVGATLCGTLLVLYLWTRCGRRAGRSSGKSRTTAHGAPGLLVARTWLHSYLAWMHTSLGLGIAPSMHHPGPSFCRQATFNEDRGHRDIIRGLGSHTPSVQGKGPSGPRKTPFCRARRAEQLLRWSAERTPSGRVETSALCAP